jgi:hypothetical protein
MACWLLGYLGQQVSTSTAAAVRNSRQQATSTRCTAAKSPPHHVLEELSLPMCELCGYLGRLISNLQDNDQE